MVGRRLKLTESQEFPVKKVTENPILTNYFVIFYCLYEVDQLCFISLKSSLFHMKITLSATKSLYQDRGPCYLPFPFFSYTYTPHFCWEIKICCDQCFPQQIRPLFNDHRPFFNDIHYKIILVSRLLSI